MKRILKPILAALVLIITAANASAVEPVRRIVEKESLSGEIAGIKTWKPELPLVNPVNEVSEDDSPSYIEDMIAYARKYMGLRYRRGGKTPKGFDCSGFTGYIFNQFGIKLKASSSAQYTQGEEVKKGDLRPGDLVFFGGRAARKSRVGHVGMVTHVNDDGTFKFIHSANSSGITVSRSTEPYYSRRYIGARRVQ